MNQQVGDRSLPILHRLDRLDLLLEFLENRHQSPNFGASPPKETEKWCYKTVSAALEEVDRKGSIVERLQMLENQVLKILSVELGASSRSSSPATTTTPMKQKINRGNQAEEKLLKLQEIAGQKEEGRSGGKPKMNALRRKRIGCFPTGTSSC